MKTIFSGKGRIRRRTYFLRSIGLTLSVVPIYALAGSAMIEASEWQGAVKCLFVVMVCAVLVANVAQTIRRMHDINLPGWCWFILLLPFVSYLFSCGVTLIDGTAGPNRFGPDPKGRPSYQPASDEVQES